MRLTPAHLPRSREAARSGWLVLAALTLMLGLSGPARALTINVTYDSSITSLPNAAEYELAINYAVQRLQGLLTDNITVNIAVSFSSDSDDLGEGGPIYYETYYSYAQVKSYLASHAELSSTDPTPSGGLYVIPNAEAKLFGLIGASSATDGTVTFSTAYSQ